MTNDAEHQPEWTRLNEAEQAANAAIIKALKSDRGKRELPSIRQILKQARRATASAAKPATKIARLRYYAKRLDYIIQITSAEFEKRLAEGAIDEPESFQQYLEEARRGIVSLNLQIEKASLPVEEPRPRQAGAKEGESSFGTSRPAIVNPAPMSGREPLVSIAQVAAYLGISKRTFSTLRKDHPNLPVHMVGERGKRFLLSEVDTWLAGFQAPTNMHGAGRSPVSEAFLVPTLAKALVEAAHLDEEGATRLIAWIKAGCKPLPVEEKISWRTGRKTLCTFIVCAQHASLLPLKIGPKKSGKTGPYYEKAIIGGFLDQDETIRLGIDRAIGDVDSALAAFREIMSEYSQTSKQLRGTCDTLVAQLRLFTESEECEEFQPYAQRLKEAGFKGKKTVSILSELGEDMLKLFGKLALLGPTTEAAT